MLKPAKSPAGDVLIYEYGVRLDKECIRDVSDQIFAARRLYNDLVARINEIVGQMNAFVLQSAPADVQSLHVRIEALNGQFDEARARNDEDAMKGVAAERRALYPKLWEGMSATRKTLKADLASRFLSRIGKNSRCETYQLRSRAVDEGLGWATANAVLDAALQAFSTSIKKGRAPRFAKGSEKTQDALTLQFVAAGGVAAQALLDGSHRELVIAPTHGCGRRKYGELRFRLGAAKAERMATGTWQYHRPLPEGAQVGLARLVRRQVGKDVKWALQLMVKLPAPASMDAAHTRAPLVAVHMGWAADVSGRRVAAFADCPDPGLARLVQLPADIEKALARASSISSERDVARDTLMPQIKALEVRESWPEELVADLAALRKLPAQHVAIRRIHRLCRQLSEVDAVPEWLESWRKADRMRWQSAAHIARRARNARKNFYRKLAIDLARNYEAIAIEPLDLAGAAAKIDEKTGERSEFAAKARAGRVVAALYEFESALRWAAVKCGCAVLELTAPTASICAHCGSERIDPVESDPRELQCMECGARSDRKLNGAAVGWSIASTEREDAVADYWLGAQADKESREAKRLEKLSKVQEARRSARTTSAAENAG